MFWDFVLIGAHGWDWVTVVHYVDVSAATVPDGRRMHFITAFPVTFVGTLTHHYRSVGKFPDAVPPLVMFLTLHSRLYPPNGPPHLRRAPWR